MASEVSGLSDRESSSTGGGRAMITMIALGTMFQLAMVLSGHYVALIKNNVFALGGMFISLVFAALYARASARSKPGAAAGGALVGGLCALIGIAVSCAMGDVEPFILVAGTGGSAVAGAIGGLVAFVVADAKRV